MIRTPLIGQAYGTTKGVNVHVEIWMYREASFGEMDLVGYTVEATDGKIGKIDEASNDVGASYVIVDTGPWIFGKKVMLPAGVIDRVDHDDETVYANRSKDEIKSAPEYDAHRQNDETYRGQLGDYYGSRTTAGAGQRR
jgi:hypothetical protein